MVSRPYGIYCFDIVGKIVGPELTRLSGGLGLSENDLCASIEERLGTMSSEYYSQRRPRIPFADPLYRIAHLFSCTPINAQMVNTVLQSDSELRKWLYQLRAKSNGISVCALGGGPGTEILGVAKWIERQNFRRPTSLNVVVADKFVEWREDWSKLCGQLNKQVAEFYGKKGEKLPVVVSGQFLQADLLDQTSFRRWNAFRGKDLYIACFVISSLFNEFEHLIDYMCRLVSGASKGSKFLFIDRAPNSDRWKNPIWELAGKAGLKISPDNPTISGSTRDPWERPSDLGKLYTGLELSPRTTWKAFWIVGTKV